MSDTPAADPAPDRPRGDANDHLEMWVGSTRDRIPLRGERLTIGQAPTNDIPLAFDKTVSRVHCVIEPVASRWCVRDLSSRNGTLVNGERIWGEQPLHSGDEIRVGTVRFVARLEEAVPHGDETVGAETGPALTEVSGRCSSRSAGRCSPGTSSVSRPPPGRSRASSWYGGCRQAAPFPAVRQVRDLRAGGPPGAPGERSDPARGGEHRRDPGRKPPAE